MEITYYLTILLIPLYAVNYRLTVEENQRLPSEELMGFPFSIYSDGFYYLILTSVALPNARVDFSCSYQLVYIESNLGLLLLFSSLLLDFPCAKACAVYPPKLKRRKCILYQTFG